MSGWEWVSVDDFTAPRVPVVKIHKDGHTWWGVRTLEAPGSWLATCVSPPLASFTRWGIERKARRWVEKEQRRQAQRADTATTITADPRKAP